MNPARIAGIVLIVAGCLGLVYGGFSHTRETASARLGPIELTVQQKKTVNVPLIASAAVIAIGVFLLVGFGRK